MREQVREGTSFAKALDKAEKDYMVPAGVIVGRPVLLDVAAILDRAGQVWNLYGPTETTVWSTVEEVGDGSVTVGRPVANTPDVTPASAMPQGTIWLKAAATRLKATATSLKASATWLATATGTDL